MKEKHYQYDEEMSSGANIAKALYAIANELHILDLNKAADGNEGAKQGAAKEYQEEISDLVDGLNHLSKYLENLEQTE